MLFQFETATTTNDSDDNGNNDDDDDSESACMLGWKGFCPVLGARGVYLSLALDSLRRGWLRGGPVVVAFLFSP